MSVNRGNSGEVLLGALCLFASDTFWRQRAPGSCDAFSFDFRADPVDEALFVLEATHARGVDKKLLESADELEGDLISATRVRIERAAGASKALVAGVARRYQNGENWVGTSVNLGSSAHSDVTPTSRFGR
jgi:hypothetical protein